MRQVTLLDAGAPVAPSSKVRAVIRSLARPPRPQAWEMTRTSDLITRDIERPIPALRSNVGGAQRLRHGQPEPYFTFGWMSPITLGKGELQTDLTHWTCALPLYEPRTPNLLTPCTIWCRCAYPSPPWTTSAASIRYAKR